MGRPLFPSLSSIKTLPPHQPSSRGPGSRDEPRRLYISLESTSVKWKPNSLRFLYRSVSSTQKPTVFPAREGEETALSHSLHHVKPFDGHGSCCLLITGQTSQRERCCIGRSPEQSSNCLGEAGALGVEHFHVNDPHWLSGLGAALVEWRGQSNEDLWGRHTADWLWEPAGCISVSGCWRYDERAWLPHHPCSRKTLNSSHLHRKGSRKCNILSTQCMCFGDLTLLKQKLKAWKN